ncbi:MAG: hypothetical protein AMXMBFR64_40810 [Myxococcales bacterium]
MKVWGNPGEAGARCGTEGPYRRAPLTARTAAGRRHVQQHRQAVVATLIVRERRLSVMAGKMAEAPRSVKKNLKGGGRRELSPQRSLGDGLGRVPGRPDGSGLWSAP